VSRLQPAVSIFHGRQTSGQTPQQLRVRSYDLRKPLNLLRHRFQLLCILVLGLLAIIGHEKIQIVQLVGEIPQLPLPGLGLFAQVLGCFLQQRFERMNCIENLLQR